MIQFLIAIDSKLDFSEVGDLVKRDKSNVKTTNIKGLRVTVDTSELGSTESKSSNSDSGSRSSETVENTKSTKIGVRTDITFEISNEANDTKVDDKIDKKKDKKDKNDDDDDDGIVPVFKGRPSTPGSKSKPGIIGVLSNSNEIPIISGFHSRSRPVETPVFHPVNDQHNQYGGDEDWSRFLPKTAIWTTERSFRRYDSQQFHNKGKFINFTVFKRKFHIIDFSRPRPILRQTPFHSIHNQPKTTIMAKSTKRIMATMHLQ